MAENKPSAENQTYSVEIDLSARSVKATGTREFIDEQFARFKDMLAVQPKTRAAKTKTRAAKPKKRRGRPKAKPKKINLIPLELKGGEGVKSLKDYVKGAKVHSNYERCTLYLYYLQRILGRKTVLHGEIGECFRHLGLKVPANIQVCLSEAKRKYKYVDMPGNGTVKLTPTGTTLVEKKLFAE
ncbi:MAG: hypothetical protein A2Y64_00280 [Candidatus Coatesbacteria bacterium RBG_13_66_14]|uniref:Uncharacterized protein n=1 Tax=Candidatus Coatesbacteria bacterium RBG_13_66_14 TaxID=1817816 RepID=A0A1F5FJH3_9BACT|nr:MAG: hypothetical protein A2Y64_00280 [Candidatus Coatesbacteria bacterium RBG_13_66_14]